MTVQELIKVLEDLKDPGAVIDMASDEEGNSFGDIGEGLAEGYLKDGRKAYTLYPDFLEEPTERYDTRSEEEKLKDYYGGKSTEE